MKSHKATWAKATFVCIGVGAATLLAASPASAHVGATASTTSAGGYSVVTFSVPHGCDTSSTTKIAIQIPQEFDTVTPTVNPDWDVEKVSEKLANPKDDGHGGKRTERVKEVAYTAKTPLPDGLRDTFELSLQLPDEAGKTLYFPTVQTCEQGETAWIQIPKDGQSEDDLKSPAPSVTLTAAEADAHGAQHGGTAEQSAAPEASETQNASATNQDASGVAWGVTGTAVGAAGLAVGGTALYRGRKGSAKN